MNNTVINPHLVMPDGKLLPASKALGIHENYSRKNFKGTLEFQDCKFILVLYESYEEIE